MSNSKLISCTILSPNCNKPRTHAIDTITPHHMAGRSTAKALGETFARPQRGGSSNYGIGNDGDIALYVDEANRSWCSNSPENDHRAITIEVSNSCSATDGDKLGWPVSDKALESLINLCVDICKRNGKTKLIWCGSLAATNARKFAADEMRLTIHKWFTATACPGPYLEGKMPYIASEVTKRLGGGSSGGGTSSGTVYRVQVGAYKSKGNAEVMLASLKLKGYDGFIVQAGDIYHVQVGAFTSKENAESMLAKLKKAGINGFVATTNATAPTPKKTVDELAREVIRGDWGVNPERSRRLTAAGYDAKAVQARVNQIMK